MTNEMKNVVIDALVEVVVSNQIMIDRLYREGVSDGDALNNATIKKYDALTALYEITGYNFRVKYTGRGNYKLYYSDSEGRKLARSFRA